MLFPILQALLQQVGPQIQQIFTSPAVTQPLQQILMQPAVRITVLRAVASAPETVSNWYESLHPEDKKRLHRAIVWVVKDMTGDLVAAATGLPIGPFVDLAVEKVLDKIGHDNPSQGEVIYIQSELLRQLNKS